MLRKRIADAVKYLRTEMEKGFYAPDKEYIETLIYAAEGYNAWLPISAAPRDGSIVVVFSPGGEPNTAFYCDGEWKCSTRAGDIYHDPDRFMFIPSPFPPQSGSEDTQE